MKCSARDKKHLFSGTVTSYSRVFARARVHRVKSRRFRAESRFGNYANPAEQRSIKNIHSFLASATSSSGLS